MQIDAVILVSRCENLMQRTVLMYRYTASLIRVVVRFLGPMCSAYWGTFQNSTGIENKLDRIGDGLPLFLVPWGFQSNACLSIAPCGLSSVWLIQRHFLSFICCSVCVCFVLWHNFSFEILSVLLTFKILHWHRFTNIWSELLIRLVIFHVSHPHNKTDLIFVLNNRLLVLRYCYSSKLGTTMQLCRQDM
jgi:hypothetical protein